ncbi:MAG: LysE family transporter, partial [Pseudomonadota bacterium]
MEHLLVLAAVLTIFVPALILPGPDFVAVIRSASTRGRGAGVATAAGVAVGIFIFAGLSMLGLSALLQQYQWLATAIRIV